MNEVEKKQFTHLKIHTQYSICEGALRISDLAKYCKTNKIKAAGLCDSNNLCGALEFSEEISKSGTQPIIGTQIMCGPTYVVKVVGPILCMHIGMSSSDYTQGPRLLKHL